MEQIPKALLEQEFNPGPPEQGEMPRDYERRIAGALYIVGRVLDDSYGQTFSEPEPETGNVFSIYPYGTQGEIFSAIKITPAGETDLTDEYQLMTGVMSGVFSRKRRPVGTKEWQDMPNDEAVPQPYLEAVFDVGKRLPQMLQERAELRRNAPKRGFLKWFIRR